MSYSFAYQMVFQSEPFFVSLLPLITDLRVVLGAGELKGSVTGCMQEVAAAEGTGAETTLYVKGKVISSASAPGSVAEAVCVCICTDTTDQHCVLLA